MLPVSCAYFEPRIWAFRWVACSPAHASLSDWRASAGRSLNSAAAAVSPVASAAKNFWAVGSGPSGLGVHAFTVTATAAIVRSAVTRDTEDAIEADVTNPR